MFIIGNLLRMRPVDVGCRVGLSRYISGHQLAWLPLEGIRQLSCLLGKERPYHVDSTSDSVLALRIILVYYWPATYKECLQTSYCLQCDLVLLC
jgi:hypothetical protein